MATVTKTVDIIAPAAAVWSAVRDYGALDKMVPGIVTGCEMIEAALPTRRVRFADGTELVERIISCDDAAQRLVWNVTSPGFDHHNGALVVAATSAATTRVTWTADVLPDALADAFAPLMENGLAAMQRRLTA